MSSFDKNPNAFFNKEKTNTNRPHDFIKSISAQEAQSIVVNENKNLVGHAQRMSAVNPNEANQKAVITLIGCLDKIKNIIDKEPALETSVEHEARPTSGPGFTS